MKQKNILILAILWLLVMVSVVASAVTLLASGKSFELSRWVSREEYEMIGRYSRLEDVRIRLSEGYFQEVNQEDLMNGALKGMMASVQDPYTFYYTPDEMQKHHQQSGSAYKGVGLLIQNNSDGYIEIIRSYTGGPADQAGVQVGDLILRVDGIRVSGADSKSLNDAVALMKGEDGSQIVLTISRNGAEQDLTIVRGEVNVSNVSWQMLDNGVGYINIFQFTGDVVTAFEGALRELQANGMQGVVIDLRNNPGGILDDVVAIADEVLPAGVIVYTEDRQGKREDFYSDESWVDFPMTVLINDMSASASEIFAAAVQDYARGTVVGEKSYGKGVVQTVIEYEEDGAGMQYTSSSYYTPSGESIHGVGVTPDILVSSEDGFVSYSGIPDIEKDVQLQVAVETLMKEIKEAN